MTLDAEKKQKSVKVMAQQEKNELMRIMQKTDTLKAELQLQENEKKIILETVSTLQRKKGEIEKQCQDLESLKTDHDRIDKEVSDLNNQALALKAVIENLESKKQVLENTTASMDKSYRDLQKKVEASEWVIKTPELMLAYHRKVVKPAILQLDEVVRRMAMVVKAVEFGLVSEGFLLEQAGNEIRDGGRIAEAKSVIKTGGLNLAEIQDLTPEQKRWATVQQSALQDLVDSIEKQLKAYAKDDVSRESLYSWLKGKPDDLNNIIRLQRTMLESFIPGGWASDGMSKVDDWIEAPSKEYITKIVGLQSDNKQWSTYVEVTRVDDGAPQDFHALMPGDIIVELDDKKVTSAEMLRDTLSSMPMDQGVIIAYIPAKDLKLGIRKKKTISGKVGDCQALHYKAAVQVVGGEIPKVQKWVYKCAKCGCEANFDRDQRNETLLCPACRKKMFLTVKGHE